MNSSSRGWRNANQAEARGFHVQVILRRPDEDTFFLVARTTFVLVRSSRAARPTVIMTRTFGPD